MGEQSNTIWTIYLHTLICDCRRYVGLTKKTMTRRWKDHVYNSQHSSGGKSITSHFANAIRKYGKEAFSHQILDQTTDLEDANFLEEKWIELLETRDPQFGFNITRGGSHTPHPIQNPWDRPGFREKISASMKKHYEDPVHLAFKSIISQEVLSRPEVRKKLSEATKRQFATLESRQIQSELLKQLHKDPELSKKFASGFKRTDALRAARTHCKNGHEFSPENTRVAENGARQCKKCQSNRVARRQYDNRTHCRNGHEFSGENIKFTKNGRSRICVKCLPTHCKRGHDLTAEGSRYKGQRGCRLCKLVLGRILDRIRRERRRSNRV